MTTYIHYCQVVTSSSLVSDTSSSSKVEAAVALSSSPCSEELLTDCKHFLMEEAAAECEAR